MYKAEFDYSSSCDELTYDTTYSLSNINGILLLLQVTNILRMKKSSCMSQTLVRLLRHDTHHKLFVAIVVLLAAIDDIVQIQCHNESEDPDDLFCPQRDRSPVMDRMSVYRTYSKLHQPRKKQCFMS